jgi:hypothetical protein
MGVVSGEWAFQTTFPGSWYVNVPALSGHSHSHDHGHGRNFPQVSQGSTTSWPDIVRLHFVPTQVERAPQPQTERVRRFCRRIVVVLPHNQAGWTSQSARIGARGGARAAKPRCVRILMINTGSSVATLIFS